MVCETMSLFSTSDAHRIFSSLDKNNDGFLSLDELNWLLEKVGVHASEDELVSLVGKDGLNFDEFCYFYESILLNNNNHIRAKSEVQIDIFDDFGVENDHAQEEEDEEEGDKDLYKAFKVFDLNDDGLISSQELQIVLWKLGMWGKNGRVDIDRIMSKYDVNSDGFVDFGEFKIMMLAH